MNWERLGRRLQHIPDMPALIGRDRMFQSAVLIPLLETEEGWEILFQERASGIRQGGEICFPGGGFDSGRDADFRATVLRECSEELGIDARHIEILGSPGSLVTPMNVLVHCYIGRIAGCRDFHINKDEVARIFTIPLDWFAAHPPTEYSIPLRAHPHSRDEVSGDKIYHFPAAELELPERYASPWGAPHSIWTYATGEGLIWGITAEILRDVLSLISDE